MGRVLGRPGRLTLRHCKTALATQNAGEGAPSTGQDPDRTTVLVNTTSMNCAGEVADQYPEPVANADRQREEPDHG